MSDWYVSSVAYAAIPVWQASHAYSVGDIVRPTAPAFGKEHPQRCTVAGTSGSTEPTWSLNNNGTVASGATFANVAGQSAYGWGAAAGTYYALAGATGTSGTNRNAVGDRVFVSSDHAETNSTSAATYNSNLSTAAFGLLQVISVNRAGSVPPTASDVTAGAAITASGSANLVLDPYCNIFWQGITFTVSGSSQTLLLASSSNANKANYFKDCALVINNTSSAGRIGSNEPAKTIFDNTTVKFGATTQGIGAGSLDSYPLDLTWINTPNAAIQGATVPATLFATTVNPGPLLVTCRGVDLSAITGNLFNGGGQPWSKILLDSCKIASGVARFGSTTSQANDEVELVNCWDGTNVLNERYTPAGAVTTDRNTYLISGAADDVSNYALKLVSSARSDIATLPLDSFWLDVENIVTGVLKTATVEIISSVALNTNDIRLLLEFMGTSGNPVASFSDSLTSILTAASALPSSSSTWNNPPGTPQKQLLQIAFTPQRAGRVRALVRLGKVSTTVWINPQVAIS